MGGREGGRDGGEEEGVYTFLNISKNVAELW